jgi:divalent metal cation (Fe/Co/Zn/Cd) transporter
MSPQRSSAETSTLQRSDANSALSVSIQSVAWTVISSVFAIALGISANSAVLVAFGSVGLVDAVGSIALAYHFHHSLRHDRFADHLERLAHRVVLIGLAAVGLAAIVGGLVRLTRGESGGRSTAAMVVAATSLVVLVVLSARKRSIASRVSSQALLADAHLSAIGAAQACVALLGAGATLRFGWSWADAVATTMLGCVAVMLAVRSARAPFGAPKSRVSQLSQLDAEEQRRERGEAGQGAEDRESAPRV